MFRMYKPKNLFRVNAVQVTADNVAELATKLMGRSTVKEIDGTPNVLALEVPTFDGVKTFPLFSWILRDDNNELSIMKDEEFKKTYEVAVNRTSA